MSLSPDVLPSASTNGSRRVSIVISQDKQGIDNPAFEQRNRRISHASDHADKGPARKKSALHNSQFNYDNRKKSSGTESVRSSVRIVEDDDDRSWWYTFCLKCQSKNANPSWEPKFWQKICPHPYFPTYRQFSRIIALILIGFCAWATIYSILGDTAAPGGQLFQLILLTICAHLGGWLMTLTTLPALIGMLLTGLILQNVGMINFDHSFKEVTKGLREMALVMILIRAGLDLDPHALKRLKFTVLKLSLIPIFIEAGIIIITTHYFLDLPWIWAALLGAIVSAVAPAVVVPCLFRFREKGYGVQKGIPTLIIAVAGIDDATSVAMFGIIRSIMFSNDSLTSQIIQGPISIIGGITFGILWGLMSRYIPEKFDPFVIPLRVLLLMVGGMASVFGSAHLGYEGAGPLACVAAAFVSLVCWSKTGWDIEDNPAVTAFEIFWMIFEPILFGITGAEIKIDELDPQLVSISVGCLIAGIVVRLLFTVAAGIGSKLNLKEKFFVSLSWMAKATVQAALGPVALSVVGDKEPERTYAEKVLMTCVLSILITAPLGAILITLTGKLLLTKTKPNESLPRSRKHSMREMAIQPPIEYDEDNEPAEDSKQNV